MTRPALDVVALGAAIVDILTNVDDSFIDAQKSKGMNRGAMTLIDEARAEELYAAMPPAIETSGGSGGNTIAGIASFGGKTAFIGVTADDQLGEVFAHDMVSMGVQYNGHVVKDGPRTSRCMILVTPDGDRTMNTYLGASSLLSPAHVTPETISSAAITYLEGYLFDPPLSKEAFRKSAMLAHQAQRQIALSLSDPFCVDRHRDDFRTFVKDETDILFANESEITSLYQTQSFDDAVKAVQSECALSIITRSEKGSVIITPDRVIEIKAAPVSKVVDTTGAGDQFAAGFLYGYANGMALEECGRLASLAAAEVISHLGPRPAVRYADFVKKAA